MLSGDQRMADIFRSGVDYHMRTAEMLAPIAWGISPETWAQMGAQYEAAKVAFREARAAGLQPAKVEDPRKPFRDKVKAVNFGLLYGQGDGALAEKMGSTEDEAAKIRSAVLGNFTDLAGWLEEQRQFCARNGGVWTMWEGKPARWRPLPDIGSNIEYVRAEAERASGNTPIQGTASDYCLASLSLIERLLREARLPARPIFSVYDSIIFECRRSFVTELVGLTRPVMEDTWYTAGVPLQADFEIADGEKRWGIMTPYDVWSSK